MYRDGKGSCPVIIFGKSPSLLLLVSDIGMEFFETDLERFYSRYPPSRVIWRTLTAAHALMLKSWDSADLWEYHRT